VSFFLQQYIRIDSKQLWEKAVQIETLLRLPALLCGWGDQ
jgi:hypothetical protein